MKTFKEDKNLVFDEVPHTYKYKGELMDSVTTFLGTLFPKFDTETIAKRTAEKKGVTVKSILKEWDKKREDACDLGNKIHLYCENIVRGGHIDPETGYYVTVRQMNKKLRKCAKNEKEQGLRNGASKFFADHFDMTPITAELQMCIPELKIAGMCDALLQSSDGQYFLYDWKTNKKIDRSNHYGGKMLKPYEKIDDCNLVKYSLQMFVYKYMLEKIYSIKIAGCYLVHIKEDNYQEYKCDPLYEQIAKEIIDARFSDVIKDKM